MSDYSTDFEDFWQAYPKRNGQKRGKKPAFAVWNKLLVSERKLAMLDVEKRNRQHGWGKFIKDAERYLKHNGWEDDWDPWTPDDESKPNTGPAQHVPYEPPPGETCPYRASVKRVAIPWLMRRGGVPEDRENAVLKLIHSLAEDAKELHQRDELTDKYAQTIRDELTALMART